jgi:hypothetical protein
MGKKRVAQLLAQLKENQAKEVENAAGIYTMAKVAVDALAESEETQPVTPLLPAHRSITKQELLERYGSFNGCRTAAKQQGIKFSKTPSWAKLEAAFSYQKVVQQLVKTYLENHPSDEVEGISMQINLSKFS